MAASSHVQVRTTLAPLLQRTIVLQDLLVHLILVRPVIGKGSVGTVFSTVDSSRTPTSTIGLFGVLIV